MQTNIYEINRKHQLNDQYFSEIDSEEKAYWLGFIWADGGMSQTNPRCDGPNRLRISQKTAEKQHLQKFLEAIDSDYKIKDKPNNVSEIDINSQPFCKALIKLGYGTKTIRCHIPNIPNELIRHFIRGYFDGDGCLSIYKQHVKQWTIHRQEWSITGNKILLEEIKNILEMTINCSNNIQLKTYKRTNKAVSLRYGKISDITAIYHYMYDNASIFLKSKNKKFQEFFENHPEQ